MQSSADALVHSPSTCADSSGFTWMRTSKGPHPACWSATDCRAAVEYYSSTKLAAPTGARRRAASMALKASGCHVLFVSCQCGVGGVWLPCPGRAFALHMGRDADAAQQPPLGCASLREGACTGCYAGAL
eukprot:353350-Chlamydomonas_euryale.AAC.15